jgi:hypothetical protein
METTAELPKYDIGKHPPRFEPEEAEEEDDDHDDDDGDDDDKWANMIPGRC